MGKQRISQKAARAKGKNGELELVKILEDYGYLAKRGNNMAKEADVVGLNGLHLEVKRVENLNLVGAIAQSVKDANNDELPVVIHRKNHKKDWVVSMRFKDFMELYEEINPPKQ